MPTALTLVIVESPTKAKKIGQFLGDGYDVQASNGHVRDLPKSKIGVDFENDFKPDYVITDKGKKIVSSLKSKAKKAKEIVLATDPDREGEAIAWHLLEAWEDPKLEAKVQRAVFHEITTEAVQAALAAPRKLNIDLVDAQQARRVLDRLVGYELSPLLWRKIRRGLSAGRVQSVALRLIVEREQEIAAFKPDEYWEVDVEAKVAAGELLARVWKWQGKVYEPKSKDDVDPVAKFWKQAEVAVGEVEKKERRRTAPPPFTTASLQQQAASRLGFAARRTMQLAQQLYERGHITYHRTDSVALSQTGIKLARGWIEGQFGKEYLPDKPNFYATKSKNAQEAHEAIRPTAATLDIKNGDLTPSHQKLYLLIVNRFLASQMVPALIDQTTIVLEAKEGKSISLAKITGSVVRFPGWLAAAGSGEDVILPAVQTGDEVKVKNVITNQKFTLPPPRYNDASIIKELEARGIGRPSTYASIISVILDRGYVTRKDKAFVASAVGTTVIEFLKAHFPSVIDYDFTARMENDLDDVALGQKQWTKIMSEFYGPFHKTLEKVLEEAPRMRVPTQPVGRPCSQCGFSELKTDEDHGELVIREGRFGQFISCSRYPKCEYTEKLIDKLDIPCPQCGEGEVVAKRTKKGRTFYGCSRYPQCDFASWKKPTTEV